MLRISIWCLPIQEETAYNRLHQALVEVATRVGKTLGVRDEKGMLCLFPRDLMEYGLGSEIVVEAKGHCLEDVSEPLARELARAWGRVVKELYPDARVEAEVPNASGVSYWSSQEDQDE